METSESSKPQEPVESQIAVAEPSLPSPPSPQRQRRPWIVLLATVVLMGGGVSIWRFLVRGASPLASQSPPGILVKVQKAQASPVQKSSTFLGTLEAKQGVVLRPKTKGRVTQIFVSTGTSVTPGQPIMELSPQRTQADFRAAVAMLKEDTIAISTAQAQLRAVEGERGTALAEVEAQNTKFQQMEKLFEQGAVAKVLLDQVRRDRTVAQETLNAIDEQIRVAKDNLTQAKASLTQAKANTLTIEKDLQNNRLIAPIAGVVGDIPIKLGVQIQAGDILTTIVQNQTLELTLNIPMEQQDQLQVGLPIELSQTQSQIPLATGRISFISPTINSENQSVTVKASFANPKGQLRNGQRVEAKVIWQTQPGVLVPTTAISKIGGKPFVFIADRPQQPTGEKPLLVARQQPVELGSIQGKDYQVISGIQADEIVVISELQTIREGSPLVVDID
ncbi:MAG: efflux RND transporter periplasmic adaptor subunit [Acaryochloris sp. SU_5_25]|nr:efflux RND transporter periplasmic adaptor subunit [Acaryochloris sp. SU_5_25]